MELIYNFTHNFSARTAMFYSIENGERTFLTVCDLPVETHLDALIAKNTV
jgi:hypothetical protein